jgi:hypothetical protein
VRPVDGDELGVGVGVEVRLAARSVVLDEDEDEVVIVVCELVGEEAVSVVLLLLWVLDVDRAVALELVVLKAAAEG